jgi:hypothetical protein
MTDLIDMGELGPLDRMEVAVGQAIQYDDMLLSGNFDDAQLDKLRDQVEALDNLFTLVGRNVIAGGNFYVPVIDNDGDRIGYSIGGRDETVVKGVYRGFTTSAALTALFEDEFLAQTRVVHLIETGAFTLRDRDYAHVTIRPTERLLAKGAVIEPLDPYDSHSLADLAGDRVTMAIQALAQRDLPLESLLAQIATLLVPNAFPGDPATAKLYRERLSFVNSLGLFEGKIALAETVLANIQAYPSSAKLLKPATGTLIIDNIWGVEMLNEFNTDGPEPFIGGRPQMFLRGHVDGTEEVLLPYKDSIQFGQDLGR